jgi:hypothetical protein
MSVKGAAATSARSSAVSARACSVRLVQLARFSQDNELQVWAVLTDLAAYKDWNPFIVSSRGTIRAGATLTKVMHDVSGNTTFTPTVQVVEPGHELRWLGKVRPGGIFDGLHTFAIRQTGPDRVLFAQREDFTGIAVPFYESHLRADTLPQFRAMNAALSRAIAGTGG